MFQVNAGADHQSELIEGQFCRQSRVRIRRNVA